MKRLNYIYDDFCSIENLLLADRIARKGKSKQSGIISFDKDHDQNIADIYKELVNKTYKTSEYTTRTIYERKPRVISILPYRDRIVQHAAMNQLEKLFVSTFTADTYSCIKGQGVHAASKSLSKVLRRVKGTKFCLQLDIKKFYPNIDHDILKSLLARKIKDKEMLWLLYGIIDSAPGLPIGNYLSQYFANFYLTYFDHWIKEVLSVKNYWRYADDMVILSDSKEELHALLAKIKEYLAVNLKLTVKGNHRVFPIEKIGIDFVGYVHFHTHKLLRKSIKQAFARVLARRKKANNPETFKPSIDAYLGWAKHSNSTHLIKKLMPHESDKIIQRFQLTGKGQI